MSVAKTTSAAHRLLRRYRNSRRSEAHAPLDHLAHAIISEGAEEAAVKRAMAALRSAFVNWNECRLARRAELARLLDELPSPDERAVRLRDMLNRLFDLSGSMDLTFLDKLKPSEARRHLLDLDSDMPRPVISMILFQLCPGAALPISKEGLRLARKLGLGGRSAAKNQLQKALLAELPAEEAGELVQYIEQKAAADSPTHQTTSSSKKSSRTSAVKRKAATSARKKASKKKTTTKKKTTAKKKTRRR